MSAPGRRRARSSSATARIRWRVSSGSSDRSGAIRDNHGWRAGRWPCGWGGSNERLDHQRHHTRAEGAAARDRIVSQRRRPVGDPGRDREPGRQSRAPSRGQSPVLPRQRARQERLRAQPRRRVRQPRHSARRAAARDRQSDGAHGARREIAVSTRIVGRPEPDEIPSHYVGYIKRVPELDPVIVCAAQIEDTATMLRGLSETDAMYRYDRGKWSVKEVVGHLADIERIMAYRALRIARGDTTPLPSFDENAYVPVAKFDARSLADLVGELRTARAATLALLRTFDADAWRRRGTASGKPVSVRALAYMIPGHERHHVEILKTRYGIGSGGQP